MLVDGIHVVRKCDKTGPTSSALFFNYCWFSIVNGQGRRECQCNNFQYCNDETYTFNAGSSSLSLTRPFLFLALIVMLHVCTF